MSIIEANNLHVNDLIDYRKNNGLCLLAKIVEKNNNILKIHYQPYDDCNLDCYSDYIKEINRFAIPNSISSRPTYHFKYLRKGDLIDLCPIFHQLNQWVIGEIKLFDK